MCKLGHSTAKERVRVAHELTRRPVIRAAFADGRLGYATVRVLTRLDGLDDDRDARFVAIAVDSSVRALDARVRNWNSFNNQDNKPSNLDDRYGLFRSYGFGGGLGRIVLDAPDDLLDRVVALLDTYRQWLWRNEEPKTLPAEGATVEPPTEREDLPRRTMGAQRADALFDLMEEIALVRSDKLDPEIAAINVTVAYEDLVRGRGLAATEYGTTLTGEAARRLACDAGIHRIVVNGISEILDVGRKTRTWNYAQRRVIRARHGFRCAAQGCNRRITQIHHIRWWENDGDTSVENGVPLCSYHHHLVHEGGWTISYDPTTGVTRMEGPLGQILETEAQLLVAT